MPRRCGGTKGRGGPAEGSLRAKRGPRMGPREAAEHPPSTRELSCD